MKNNIVGLTSEEVKIKISNGQSNVSLVPKTKTNEEIIKDHSITYFNILNIVLALMVLISSIFSGKFLYGLKNCLFVGVAVTNTIISIIESIYAKNTIEKLNVLAQSKIKVLRDEEIIEVNQEELVLNDVCVYELGNQVVTDVKVLSGKVEVNESFITGEADTVYKKKGDMLLSGSFIVSGNCYAKVEHVGMDNYTAKISANTKKIKNNSSEIMRSLNKIITTVSFLIIPLGILLYFKQLSLPGNTTNEAILNTVAALIGMIPEGLVLLTSTVLAVGVIRLAQRKVLVQDLYCIEALARVDTICLDKTGTITEGIMEVVDVVDLDKEFDSNEILANINYQLNENNPTGIALNNKFGKKDNYKLIKKIPFSSAKKYSGCEFDKGKFLIGAPEFILGDKIKKYKKELDKYIKEYRVIALVKDDKIISLLLLQDIVRKEAKATLDFFKSQGVKVKIISGDNPNTVYNIALKAGLDKNSKMIDARELTTDEEIFENIENYDVFGRVSPEQKRKFILALQRHGHSVAMTGDGVNDVLALKEADCSVAMASGTDAAKNVSQLVLLDSNFASMPYIVDEGRRSVNNIQRSASLFLVKTIYASVLSFIFIFLNSPYPFIPIQLTLTSVLTVGIPSVILGLEPNHNIIKGKFLHNVLVKAVPFSISIIVGVLLVNLFGNVFDLARVQVSTLTAVVTTFNCFILLYKVCIPFNLLHKVLFSLMFVSYITLFVLLNDLFGFSSFSGKMILIFIICGFVCLYIINYLKDNIDLLTKKIF